MINDLKDRQNKTDIDKIWKKYGSMDEKESSRKGDKKDKFVKDKKHLMEIVEALERDNLVMYDEDNGNVIMI